MKMNIPIKNGEVRSNEIGDKLKRLLTERHASITALAEYSGLSRPTLYRILEGRSELKLKDAIAICKFFNISLEELYDLEAESPKNLSVSAAHFGLTKFDETTMLQRIYRNLARKELAQILREAATMLEQEEGK
jgi:transcriptional regulator with XRE-family HTH domain